MSGMAMDTESDEQHGAPTRIVVSFVVFPVVLTGLLVGTGVYLSAHNPAAWYTVAVRFVAGLF